MTAEQVIGERPGALVGDDRHVGADHALEQLGRQVVLRSRRRSAGLELARALGERAHLAQRFCRKRRMRHHGDRRRGHEADGDEILQRIVAGIGIEDRVDRRGPAGAHHQRVAVGRSLDRRPRADHAGSTPAVVDDDLLTERARQALRGDSCHCVHTAAGRKRHHHGDRARGIDLCPGVVAGHAHERRNARDQSSARRGNGGDDWVSHGLLPCALRGA